jgi:hypothetical protein
VSFSKDTIPDAPSWFLSILELVIVIGIALFVGYAVFCFLLFGSARQAGIVRMTEVVNQNWKAALVLLIPLVYRPARIFLENLEEAGTWKRRKLIPPADKQEEKNPAKGDEAGASAPSTSTQTVL